MYRMQWYVEGKRNRVPKKGRDPWRFRAAQSKRIKFISNESWLVFFCCCLFVFKSYFCLLCLELFSIVNILPVPYGLECFFPEEHAIAPSFT